VAGGEDSFLRPRSGSGSDGYFAFSPGLAALPTAAYSVHEATRILKDYISAGSSALLNALEDLFLTSQ
jgi:hypothetical protein